jgi:TonB family protein
VLSILNRESTQPVAQECDENNGSGGPELYVLDRSRPVRQRVVLAVSVVFHAVLPVAVLVWGSTIVWPTPPGPPRPTMDAFVVPELALPIPKLPRKATEVSKTSVPPPAGKAPSGPPRSNVSPPIASRALVAGRLMAPIFGAPARLYEPGGNAGRNPFDKETPDDPGSSHMPVGPFRSRLDDRVGTTHGAPALRNTKGTGQRFDPGPATPGPGPGTGTILIPTVDSQDPLSRATLPTSDGQPVISFKPTPRFSEEALRAGVDGDVELDVVFTADGVVRVLTVVHGPGYGLNEEAVRIAKQIRFAPGRLDGEVVDVHTKILVVFRLS